MKEAIEKKKAKAKTKAKPKAKKVKTPEQAPIPEAIEQEETFDSEALSTMQKLNKIMCWDYLGDDDTHVAVFTRNGGRGEAIADPVTVDIVHAGGLQVWAESLNVSSQQQLYDRIMRAVRKTVSEPIFQDKKRMNAFPPVMNFFMFCQRMDRLGKTHKDVKAISEFVWNTVIARRRLAENVAKMFSVPPNRERYKFLAGEIRKIWGFSLKDVDAIRYFVCQVKNESLNPSLNKSLFIWGKNKQAGKSTVARAIITVLNGDEFDNFGNYESTLNTEMQYNDHDIPLMATTNAVMLDEAMPRDSRKSYPMIKQMLTSNSCKYNQKYGEITRLRCRRNYIWISNDSIDEFIQDEKERRFYSINLENYNKSIGFGAIRDIWREFCIHCQPETDWQDWYNSFEFVSGMATRDRDEMVNEINLHRDALFPMTGGGQTSSVQVARKIFKNEPTREQRAATKAAMELLFSDCKAPSNPYIFNVNQCRSRLLELSETVNGEGGGDEGYPF
jgi:hypothetical protein